MKFLHKFYFLLLTGLILRLYFVFSAYHGDLNNNISWGQIAVSHGLSGFYDLKNWPYSAPNQPPLTILLFAGLQIIWNTVERLAWWFNNHIPAFPSAFVWFWEDRGLKLLIKLPSIFADLGIATVLYQYFIRLKKPKTALLMSTFWVLNPVVWFNSSIWGQTDSIVNLLGLSAIVALLSSQLTVFSFLFILSLLFKGSLAIFIPILLVVALTKKFNRSQWLKSILAAVLTTIFISIWFHPQVDFPIWFLNLYKNRILSGEIGSLSANAFNFWWLIDNGKTLDSTIYFSTSARLLGFLVSSVVIGGLCLWLKHNLSNRNVLYGLALSALVTFLFMTRIHERYLYPFFPIATLLSGLVPLTTLAVAVLSVSNLLNIYHLFNAASFAPLEIIYKVSWLPNFIAVVNLLVFSVLLLGIKRKKGYN